MEGQISLEGRTARKTEKEDDDGPQKTVTQTNINRTQTTVFFSLDACINVCLPWQSVAALPMPSAWLDSGCLYLMAW